MKKLVFLFLISICTISAYTYDFKVDGIYYEILGYNESYSRIEVEVAPPGLESEYSGDIIIPSTVEYDGYEYIVTAVGKDAFSNCELTSVVIPKGVLEIKARAFSGAKQLKTVELPLTLNKIENYAFGETESLEFVEIPKYTTEIACNAFSNSGLHRMIIPKSVTKIGDDAFDGCYQMTTLIFEESDIPIRSYNIDKPEQIGVKPRGYLFLGRNFEDLDRDRVRNEHGIFLESRLTYESHFLKTVEIASSVKKIAYRTFANDTGIEKINCFSPTPPEYAMISAGNLYFVDAEYFTKEVYENAVLYVPEGSLEAYKAHEVWGNFKNIVEGNITIGIDEIAQDDNHPKIYTKGMAIMVEGSNDAESVSVYSIDGRLIYAGKSDCIEVDAAGIYIVRIGNYSTKVIL